MAIEGVGANAVDLLKEFGEAAIEGGKAGVYAELANTITEKLLDVSGLGAKLPEWMQGDRVGAKILPILVCYLVALLTVIMPTMPKAKAVRKACLRAAQGQSTIVAAEQAKHLKGLSTLILGAAAVVDVDGD